MLHSKSTLIVEPPEHQHGLFICLLGSFRVFRNGEPIGIRSGGKGESLLSALALRCGERVPRDLLLSAIWPESETDMAGTALSSLVCSLQKLLAAKSGKLTPIVNVDGCYQINEEADVAVDVACFDSLLQEGNQHARAGELGVAMELYQSAVDLYRGDLCVVTDVYAIVERERLRSDYLTILARLADYHYERHDYTPCVYYARCMLSVDPCREDAHRLIMRAHVKLGQRAQALRQYRLCQELLCAEFAAPPEASTTELFNRVRLDPSSI